LKLLNRAYQRRVVAPPTPPTTPRSSTPGSPTFTPAAAAARRRRLRGSSQAAAAGPPAHASRAWPARAPCQAPSSPALARALRIAAARRLLSPLGATLHGSPIVPLIIGGNAETMALAARLQAQGFDIRGIRPPTVPIGTSRLRIVITLNVDEADIAALAEALSAARAGAPA